jgi:type I restriction enzyme S subunit
MEVGNIHFKSYKESQVGLIPSDWVVKSIGDIATFSGGSQPSLEYFSSVKRKDYIRLIQIRDYKSEKYTVYIPKKLGRKFCDETDVMIGRYGPPIFQILTGLGGAYNVALIKATPKNIEKKYLYYILKQDKLFKYIELLSQRSSGQTGVDLKGLKEYNIPFPTDIKEQKAIATALSDIDDLILSLQKLINKKKLIKDGAMEELLAGKKRLEGFNEDWEEKILEDIVQFSNGKAHENSLVDIGEFLVVNSKFISTCGSVKKYTNEPYCLADKNDILMVMSDVPNGKAIAKCFIVNEDNKYTVNQRICKLTVRDGHYKYLFYIINRNKYYLSYDDGVKQTNLKKSDVLGLKLRLPKYNEQEAIATILSDMDEEIEKLEKKLDKYKNIKSGMMKELLTGKRRLV